MTLFHDVCSAFHVDTVAILAQGTIRNLRSRVPFFLRFAFYNILRGKKCFECSETCSVGRSCLTALRDVSSDEYAQLTWLALGRDHAGGSRSAEQVTAL